MDKYLAEFVYGGIDGIITTFSIVAGSEGGNLLRNVIIVLGISNVISDGFSMGVSRYVSSDTEIKQGLLKNKNPYISGIVTFLSFVLVGILPILPFIISKNKNNKYISFIISLIVFTLIGYVKGYITKENKIKTSTQTLMVGTTAAALAYSIGHYTKYIK